MAYEFEILVDVHANSIGIDRKTDAFNVKLAGAGEFYWGSECVKVFQVVLWPALDAEQEELDARDMLLVAFNKKLELGDPNPSVWLPFAEYIDEKLEDDNGQQLIDPITSLPIIEEVITNRSILSISFSLLSGNIKKDILDKTKADIPYDLQDYYKENTARLGLTGKFLPVSSNLFLKTYEV